MKGNHILSFSSEFIFGMGVIFISNQVSILIFSVSFVNMLVFCV